MTNTVRHSLPILVVFALGLIAGRGLQPESPASAEIRRSPAREAFKSGGARSEEVLLKISKTLDRIDDRVAKIEEAVAGAR